MLEKFSQIFHLAYRQTNAIQRVADLARSAFTGGFSVRKIIAVIVAFAEMFGCVLFDYPLTPAGQELNLDGYTLVFEDEFEGSALNEDYWFYRGNGSRRNGFNCPSQVKIENGNMIMTGEYLEDGEYGSGWYAGMIALKQQYCRGYFEIKCKCNDGGNFWSAFWIQAPDPYNHEISKGGVGGAEIDIFESFYNADKFSPLYNSVAQTIHCNGSDDDAEHIDSRMLGRFKGNDIYNEYNTYGLEWTEDEYIFYINGVETVRSSFGSGVSEVPETVIVSLEIPDDITLEKSEKTQFTVDYVRIYQK